MECYSLGGGPGRGNKTKGTGFAWTKRPLTDEERLALAQVARAVGSREHDNLVRDVLDDDLEAHAFESLAEEYLESRREELEKAERLVEQIRNRRVFE